MSAIANFIAMLKTMYGIRMSKTIVAIKHRGFYCKHLLNTFAKLKCNIVVENAVHIKRSMGLVGGKDDKADSIRDSEVCAEK
jgi:hypothetical protein